MKKIEKFLQFKGKKLFFVSKDGQYWIAIKPICEALNVHYPRQREKLQELSTIITALDPNQDPTLVLKVPNILSEQPFEGKDGQIYKMLCINEFYVYGWIFMIESPNNPELFIYKLKCYELLYNYFHGAITGRKEILDRKAKAENTINNKFKQLSKNEDFNDFLEAHKDLERAKRAMIKYNQEEYHDYKTLFDDLNN